MSDDNSGQREDLVASKETATAEAHKDPWWSSMFPWFYKKAEITAPAGDALNTTPEGRQVPDGWLAYYWAMVKEFGAECLHISRSDMLASVLAIAFVFLINRNDVDLRMAVQAAFATFVTLGILHSLRVPWLLIKKTTAKEQPLEPVWGILGLLFLSVFVACILYTGAWFYTMQPPVTMAISPDANAHRVVELETQIEAMKIEERPDSLRRRTVKLVSELNDFWSKNPQPPFPQSVGDQDSRKKEFVDDWRRIQNLYDQKGYKDRVIGIIREYKTKGVATGFLEAGAENHVFGASPFSSPVCWSDELCQFRELAFHVDARDQVISPTF